jgi:hypothetical protein
VMMSSISTISFNAIFREDTPQYILDFFYQGKKDQRILKVLLDWDFDFGSEPNFAAKKVLICSYTDQPQPQYSLFIQIKFDFDTEAAQSYWFIGGMAQYCEDSKMAGYVTHEDGSIHLFAFKDGLPYSLQGLRIDTDYQKVYGQPYQEE